MYQNMELNDINEDYKKSQARVSKLGPAKEKVETLKKEIKSLTRDIEDLLLAKDRAQEDGDIATVQKIDPDLRILKAGLKARADTLKKIEEVISKTESELDKHMESLKQMEQDNPEFLEHMNTVIAKKFSRKAHALQNEKKELASRNEQLAIIKEAAQKDRYVMNTLKGIEHYTEIIEKYSDSKSSKRKKEVREAKAKLSDRRNDLKAYFKGSISEEVINSLTGFGNIDKDIKTNTRQIKGIDKSVANYRTALGELGYTLDDVPDKSVSFDSQGHAFVDISSSSNKDDSKALPPAEKPKWYQFIKRFKNWRNARKLENEKNESEPVIEEKPNSFKDSMKYDVVKDYEAKLEQELLRNAKVKNKGKAPVEKSSAESEHDEER